MNFQVDESKLGPQQLKIAPETQGIPWHVWAAKRINKLFLDQGQRGKMAEITPASLKEKNLKWTAQTLSG